MYVHRLLLAQLRRPRQLSTTAFAITTDLTAPGGPRIGSFAQVEHVFSQKAVAIFATISGDNNPLHLDPDYASKTAFGGAIVHGILVSGLFSTLFGRTIHGCVYLNQTLEFKKPVYVGANVLAKVEVTEMKRRRSDLILVCSTNVYAPSRGCDEMKLAVCGSATVLIPRTALGGTAQES